MDPMIAALLRPEAYGHPVEALELLETHASWVILTGPYAYKLKKPVNFGLVELNGMGQGPAGLPSCLACAHAPPSSPRSPRDARGWSATACWRRSAGSHCPWRGAVTRVGCD